MAYRINNSKWIKQKQSENKKKILLLSLYSFSLLSFLPRRKISICHGVWFRIFIPVLWEQGLFIIRVSKEINKTELIISIYLMCSSLSAVLHFERRQEHEKSSSPHFRSLDHELVRKELCPCETQEWQNAKLVFQLDTRIE